jgi:hypothetical protein
MQQLFLLLRPELVKSNVEPLCCDGSVNVLSNAIRRTWPLHFIRWLVSRFVSFKTQDVAQHHAALARALARLHNACIPELAQALGGKRVALFDAGGALHVPFRGPYACLCARECTLCRDVCRWLGAVAAWPRRERSQNGGRPQLSRPAVTSCCRYSGGNVREGCEEPHTRHHAAPRNRWCCCWWWWCFLFKFALDVCDRIPVRVVFQKLLASVHLRTC